MKYETFEVVGLDHRLTKLMQREIEKQLPLTAGIVREPNNKTDNNAMLITVADKKSNLYGTQVGYLRRQVAQELAPGVDDGSLVISSVMLTEIYLEDGEAEVEIGLDKGKIGP